MTVADLIADLRTAGPDDFVAFDTETGGSPEGRAVFGDKATFHPYAGAYATGISVCVVRADDDGQLRPVYVPVGHERGNADPRQVSDLIDALNYTRARHVVHHGVFDYPFIAQLGHFEPRADTIDMQVTRWYQDENAVKKLKDMGEMFLGEDASAEQRALADAMKSPWENQTQAYKAVREAYPEVPVEEARAMARRMRLGRGWHQLEVDELAPYAARDASLTYEVGGELLPDVFHQGAAVEPGLAREFALQPILYGMTKRGIPVSIEKLDAAALEYDRRAEIIRGQLFDEHKIDNPASSQQTARLLYDRLGLPVLLRTKKGAPATDKNALEMLQGHPIAKLVLEYRKWRHAADSYAVGFAKHARLSADGRVHGHYRSDGTVTGRLSASGPNVTTIPREDSLPEIAEAFAWTPPGLQRYRFDLASAELWVTASFTGDPMLTDALLEGRNLHIETMLAIFGGEADKDRREYTLSKNGNYGIEYGAGLAQLSIYAAKVGCSPREAKAVAKRFSDGHKRTFAKQHAMAAAFAELAEREGKIPLITPGRYRHFHSPGQWPVPYYTALNALVQGGVAEWVKTVMLEIKARGYEELLTLQVHDELWFEGPPGMEQELQELLDGITRDCNPFRYPIPWGAK